MYRDAGTSLMMLMKWDWLEITFCRLPKITQSHPWEIYQQATLRLEIGKSITFCPNYFHTNRQIKSASICCLGKWVWLHYDFACFRTLKYMCKWYIMMSSSDSSNERFFANKRRQPFFLQIGRWYQTIPSQERYRRMVHTEYIYGGKLELWKYSVLRVLNDIFRYIRNVDICKAAHDISNQKSMNSTWPHK